MNWNSKAPCLGCEDRTIEPNCHMRCEKYIEFQEEMKRANEVQKMMELVDRPLRSHRKSGGKASNVYRNIFRKGRG